MSTKGIRNLQDEMQSQLDSHELFDQAKEYAFAYLNEMNDRNVFPTDMAINDLSLFDEPFPDEPGQQEKILELLHEKGSPATVCQIGGRYYGFVNGSSVPAALASKWLADVWDQNAAMFVSSPIVSQLESVCEKWIVELLQLPVGTAAGFVSGSSTAAFCGLACGRNELLKRQGWDVNEDGLFGAPPIRVILGAQAHGTIYKALSLLGLGRGRVETVPVDSQGRMIVSQMPALDGSCLVITQAGNVSSGAFDPISEICDRANAAHAWVHVDGAFGLWAAASKKKQYLTRGIEKADSWSLDAHKTLNAPYDCGIVLCKDREDLLSSMQISGAYIVNSDRRDNMHYTPEMSRRGRAVELWATLKSLGKNGVEDLVDRLCDHAELFAKLLQAQGFQVLNDVVFNQVLVSCASAELTRATLENIQRSGECWCGGSIWNGIPVIRISVCSWATTEVDVERSVAAFVKAREKTDRES
jgi:glutamate/tyrosine decarboxylase-like PLP-dependent enzyme